MRKEADCLRALRAGHSSHCARCPWLAPPRLRAVLCCAEFAVFIPDPRVGLSRQTFLLICSTRVRLNNSDLSCCMAALCAHCEKTPAWGRDLEFACPVRPTQDRPGGNNNGQMCSRGACFFYWCYSNSAGQKIWVSDRTVFVVEEDQTDNPGRAGRDA